jgi:class 3 adenylate cyclase
MQHISEQQVETLKRENVQLQRAVRELSLLNDVARAMGGAGSLDKMIRIIVKESIRATGSEQGTLLLLDDEPGGMHTLIRTTAEGADETPFRPGDDVVGWMHKYRRPLRVNDPTSDERFKGSIWPSEVETLLCVPLLVQNRLIGLLALYNSRRSEYSANDERLIGILAAQSAQIIAHARASEDKERVMRVFGQHMAPEIVDQIVKIGPDLPSRLVHDVTIMFLDLRGFSSLAEHAKPEEVVAYLDALFPFMIEIVAEYGGMVHQLLGDGFMALFGAPVSHGNDPQRAVDAAQAIIAEVDHRVEAGTLRPTRLGIGIHVGDIVAGTIGKPQKFYTVTGDVVNVAARIEQLTKEFDCRILVSSEVLDQLEDPPEQVTDLGPVDIRGRIERVQIYSLA